MRSVEMRGQEWHYEGRDNVEHIWRPEILPKCNPLLNWPHCLELSEFSRWQIDRALTSNRQD